MPNTPYLFGSYGAELHGKNPLIPGSNRVRLFYDSSVVKSYFYDYETSRNQSRSIPGYWVHTVGLQQTFGEGLYSASAEIVNVSDVLRFDQFNRPLPGRVFRVLLRGTFLDE